MTLVRSSFDVPAALAAASLMLGQVAGAATISWSPTFVVDDPGDVSHPPASIVHLAADFNTPAGTSTPGGDDVINGIPFLTVDQNVPGLLSGNIASGPSYNATYHPGGTGDQDLDDLLDSHSYIAANPGFALITVEGLTVGSIYQLQIINVADSRACCAGRIYEPDDGLSNFTTGVTLQRGLFQSVLGTFTADAATQSFQLRSLDGVAGTNNDPGMSGLVVLELIPEPGSGMLALAALGTLLIRRRRN